MHWRPVPC